MRFLRPEFASWWQLLPVIAACVTVHALYLARQRRRAGLPARFRPLSRRSTWLRDAAIATLALGAGAAIVLALLRPQAQLTTTLPQFEREDLVIMLDRSASMRAHDVSPSRFSRATDEIRNFLKNKPENIDRVGLVGFAGTSVILSYLTRDLDALDTQRMTQWDQLTTLLRRHDPRDPRDGEDVALGDVARGDRFNGSALERNESLGDRLARREGFMTHVHHLCAALVIEVRELFAGCVGHDAILPAMHAKQVAEDRDRSSVRWVPSILPAARAAATRRA